MESGAGVQVNAEDCDPYKHPDRMVTAINTSCFLIYNLRNIVPPNYRDPNSLAPPPPRNRGVVFRLELATEVHRRPTLSDGAYAAISIPNIDTSAYNNIAHNRMIDLVRGLFRSAGPNTFQQMYNQALSNANGHRDIGYYLTELAVMVPMPGPLTQTFFTAYTAFAGVAHAMALALSPGTFPLPTPMSLYEAWHYHVRCWRRPHFELVSNHLHDLVGLLDELEMGLVRPGVDEDRVLQVRMTAYSLPNGLTEKKMLTRDSQLRRSVRRSFYYNSWRPHTAMAPGSERGAKSG